MTADRFKTHFARLVRGGSGRLLNLLASEHEKRVAEWYRLDSEGELRLNYPLTESSVVLDVGGYRGQWASDIFARYLCTVHVYEPVTSFASQLRERYAGNQSIVVHAEGLAATSRSATIYLQRDASTVTVDGVTSDGAEAMSVELMSVVEAIDSLQVETIDLLKLNIEGLEYELLECLLESGYIGMVEHLQVQFHHFVDGSDSRRAAIQEQLKATHRLDYCVPFVWESWNRISPREGLSGV